jgi:hypothetical protein
MASPAHVPGIAEALKIGLQSIKIIFQLALGDGKKPRALIKHKLRKRKGLRAGMELAFKIARAPGIRNRAPAVKQKKQEALIPFPRRKFLDYQSPVFERAYCLSPFP